MTATEVLVPIKAFVDAKQRLLIQPGHRIQLMKRMASIVLTASPNLTTWVVCDDDKVADWAAGLGAPVLMQPASGLNDAVQLAMERRRQQGVKRIVVAHGDLPLLSGLERLSNVDGVVAVPDLTDLGTKVLSVPTYGGFRFAYGPSSAVAHRTEAKRCGLAFEIFRDPRMGFDINTIDDLNRLENEDPAVFRRLTDKLDIFSHRHKSAQGQPS